MWAIKDKSGEITRCTVGYIEYNGTWMGDCYVIVTIESPVPIHFAIGDYIEYRGERFEINYDPSEIKCAPKGTKGDAFKYEQVKFNSLADELTRCDFLDYVKEDNQIHYTGLPSFSFFAATIQDLADRIQANLDRLYKDEQRWIVKVQPEYVNKTDVNIQVENKTKVWGALEYVNKHFGAYFVIRGRTITIGTAGIPTDNLFRYGKGKGLATIKKQAESDQQIITRLRVYGASDNLPTRYYNKLVDENGDAYLPNNMAVNFLMLPGFPEETQDPYIDSPNIETLGIREGSVFFDGSDSDLDVIKPSIECMTAEQLKSAGISVNASGPLDEIVEAEQTTDDGLWEDLDEGEEVPNFTITVKDLGFDINDHLTTEEAVISMKSGMLGAREFSIVKCEKSDKGYVLTCRRVYDDGLRLYFPYKSYNARPGDKFVLLHIEMPDVYIKAASQRLLEAGKLYLEKNDYSRLSYSPEIDEIYMARQHVEAMASGGLIKSLHDTIKEGDIMLFDDEDLLIDNAAVVIDNLQIKEGDEKIPKYTVTLRNEKTVGTIQRLQNQIDSIVNGGGQGAGGYNAVQIRQMIFAYGKERFLSKLEPDVAQKVIRFLEGAEFGNFVDGFSGGAVDKHGNAQFESIESRSYLKVMELIYNRLNALEGNTSFADVGTIESVESLSATRAKLTMRKRWDGDFTAFQHGDIIYGYVNDLATTGVYYKAWAWIDDVDRTANTITVNYYVGTDVPAQQNFPMTENMIVTRWGNIIVPSATTHKSYPSVVTLKNGEYINTRQSTFYVSCEDGNIVQLLGVDRPILLPGNFGTILGQIPTGLLSPEVEAMLNPQQPYFYARGIIVQDLIRIGYEGLQVTTPNYRGQWSLQTAKSPTDYYRNVFGTCDIVTWKGSLWQCVVTKTTDEPSESTGSWVNISGEREEITLSLYQIVPSANVIIVRPTVTMPDHLTCEVQRKSTEGDKTYKTTFELGQDNLKLYYSIDGIGWQEFIIGNDEPIELEDESDVIELEGSTSDDVLSITMGGADIAASDFGDSVYFQLRESDTDKVVTSLIVPVVKDGYNGDWVSYAFIESLEKPTTPDTTDVIPAGWSDAPTTEGRWWMSKATVNGTTQLAGKWSDPVQVTAEDGTSFDFKFQKNHSDINAPALNKNQRNPGNEWSDQPPQLEEGEFLWLIKAEIDADDNLVGVWSDPVRISGESAYTLDLSNEHDAVLCDSDNNVVMPSDTYPRTEIAFYRGGEQININLDNLQIVVYADGVVSENSISYGISTNGLTKEFSITDIHSMPKKLEIVFALNGRQATMTINRDNGDCIYQLVPSVNQVKRDAEGNYDVNHVSCGVKKIDRGGVKILSSLPTGYTLKYSHAKGNAVAALQEMSITGSVPTSGKTSITFYLYDAQNTIIDQETVPIVYDGTKGDKGDDGTDGSHVEMRYYVCTDGYTPTLTTYEKNNRTCGGGWTTTPKSPTVSQALWLSQAEIDADDNLVGVWSDPVRISGYRGAVGEMGERGLMAYPAGIYDIYTTYATTATSTPVVLDTETNAYYVLKPDQSWTGTDETYPTPHEDYAKSGTAAKWTLMDKFNSIFANIIMAQFAKLASSVHWGDYMFSQYGTRREIITAEDETQTTEVTLNSPKYEAFDADYYNGSDELKYPENAPFQPNLLINWLTGKLYAQSAELRGRLATGVDGERRIVVDPDSQQVSIYDSNNNEVITLEGKAYDGVNKLFGATSGNIKMAKTRGAPTTITGNSIEGVTETSTEVISDKETATENYLYTESPTEISVKGYLTCFAKCSAQSSSSGSDSSTIVGGGSAIPVKPSMVYGAHAFIQVIVQTFSDANCTKKIETKAVASCSSNAHGQQAHNGSYQDLSATKTLVVNHSVRVTAGYHKIAILWSGSCYGPGSQASASYGSDTNLMSATYSNDFYVSRVFANGFCFGERSDNYILGYKTAQSGMRFIMENNGFGLDFSSNHPKIKAGRGLKWINMPLLLFHGRGSFNTANSTYSWASQSCCTPSAPSITRVERGVIKLIYPSGWPAVNADCISVNVVGYGNIADGSNPNKAQIRSITSADLVFTLSDDTSPNDGSFLIDIYLI